MGHQHYETTPQRNRQRTEGQEICAEFEGTVIIQYKYCALCCGPRIASLPLPRYVVRGDLRAVLQRKLMLLFYVGIVRTNLYNCIS